MENRPEVILHLIISLDGKATGSFWGKKSVQTAMKESFRIRNEKLNVQAMSNGRKTFEAFSVSKIDYSKYKKSKENPREDYVIKKIKIANIIMLHLIQMEN